MIESVLGGQYTDKKQFERTLVTLDGFKAILGGGKTKAPLTGRTMSLPLSEIG